MIRTISVFLFVGLLIIGLTAFASVKPKEAVVRPDVATEAGRAAAEAPVKGGTFSPKPTADMSHVLGTTFYDYQWNSGGPRHAVYYNGITYLLYVGRTSPTALREITYVAYDGTTFSTPEAVIPGATQATYFSGIDVWRGGDANGLAGVAAGWVGSGNSYYALESAPGKGTFTSTLATNNRDTQPLHLDSLGTLLFYHTKGRTNYAFRKSTDFGNTFADADTNLLRYLPGGQTQSSLEPPLCISNGTIYVMVNVTTTGSGYVPPIGTGNPDSVRLWGYFTSTDGGTTFSWHKILSSGAPYETNRYNLFCNFSQHDMVVDNQNRIHAVTNGYHQLSLDPPIDTTFQESIDAVYWDATNGFKSLVSFDRNDTIIGAVGGIIDRRGPANTVGANGLGCSYPSIAETPDGNIIVCTWSQPNWSGTVIDTNAGGWVTKNIWYNASFDGGATWKGATKLSMGVGREDEFGCLADDLQPIPGGVRARIVYLSVATGSIGDDTDAEEMIYQEFDVMSTVDVRDQSTRLPNEFALNQNYPNPFNPSTKITYSVPVKADVSLKVYNTLGQEVATLVSDYREAGTYNVEFSAAKLTSGVYFYTLKAGQFAETKKMMLLK